MKIEKYLILNKYLLSLFGFEESKDLQEKLKDTQAGWSPEGESFFVNVLRGLEGLKKEKLPPDKLLIYDKNIRWYEDQINQKRHPRITPKYFQYLAVLFTEIFLDNLKNQKEQFLYELNQFLAEYKKEKDIEIVRKFTEEDLTKLAFWMATGSGKNSVIMMINYYQFFRYQLFSPENILLITPNENLSKQHFEDLKRCNIPARLYSGSLSHSTKGKEVLVIEITKLVEEKKGGGVTVPVDVFEGRNLVFVDEGHKGRKSEEQKWKQLRDAVSKNGFVFEYSAVFGQILSESNKPTLREYAKAIVFNYSYKYFYLDGYGKDFSVLDIKGEPVSEQKFREIMFVANLLAFYEQLLVYEENEALAGEYNLEKPLWIFVGTTVTGRKAKSDVVLIASFLNRFIQNQKWAKEKIENILAGNTGLETKEGEDIFETRFIYLKDKGLDLGDIYQRVFGGQGRFSTFGIKDAEGELGLKVGENEYFGVINVGDVPGLKKELEKKEIMVGQDVISASLFDNIKTQNSKINLLVGAKKFIEGWDTWRVSSMGLLNVGRGQGPQIIQLFGRGVRIKGKNFSLKRSGEKTPVRFLETLNIYGIRAEYLNKFLEALSKEDVELETIEIPIRPQHKNKWQTLYTLSKDENKKFEEEEILPLTLRGSAVGINLIPKVYAYKGITSQEVRSGVEPKRLPKETIKILNWENILQEVYEFRAAKNYWNLIFDQKALKKILLSDKYKILASGGMLKVENEQDLKRLSEIALLVIKKYIAKFYRDKHKRYETDNMQYQKLGKQEPLFVFDKGKTQYSYSVHVKKEEKKLIEEIKKIVEDFDKLYQDDDKILPRVHFDRHLFVPILLKGKKIEKITPEGLVESEEKFILGLRSYLKAKKEKFVNYEIYLLRNFPKSGVGFFNLSGFYPDFVLWLKKEETQKIVFIDPKGLQHTKGLDDQKIVLRKDIKKLESRLGQDNITLDSFILSKTDYDDLTEGRTKPPKKEEYQRKNVLFLEDEDWPDELLTKALRGN